MTEASNTQYLKYKKGKCDGHTKKTAELKKTRSIKDKKETYISFY